MKNIFRIFAFIALVGIVFTSCQKDNLLEEEPLKEEVLVDAQKSFSVLKGFVLTKIDKVYIMQTDGTLKEHRTIKMRNLQWTVAQEWLLDDLQTDGFQGYSFYPGDTDGSQHGYYFLWDQMEDAADNSSWQYLVYRENDYNTAISSNPFHLPKVDTNVGSNDGDITKLASILGSTSLVRQKLQMDYDGVDNSSPAFNTNHAYMWLEVRGTYAQANKVTGCGVLAKWDGQNNDHFWHSFTNITNLKANTRLVRNITSSEW